MNKKSIVIKVDIFFELDVNQKRNIILLDYDTEHGTYQTGLYTYSKRCKLSRYLNTFQNCGNSICVQIRLFKFDM